MKLLIFIAFFTSTQLTAQETPSILTADFAKLPSFESPKISPEGRFLASTIIVKGEPILLVQSTDTSIPKAKREFTLFQLGDTKVYWYEWANNDRLILNLRLTTTFRNDQVNISRLVSIGRDGKNMIVFEITPDKNGAYRQNPDVLDWLQADPEHILVELDNAEDSWAAPEVDKVNVYTGKKTRVQRNFKQIHEWITDNDSVVRLGIHRDTGKNRTNIKVYYRASKDTNWDLLLIDDVFSHNRLVPKKFHPDNNNILLVNSVQLDEKNDAELFQYDLTLQKIIGPYVDEKRNSIKKMLSEALPGTKIEIGSSTRDQSIYYIRAYEDTMAPIHFKLDTKNLQLDIIAYEYPQLQEAALAKMEKLTYIARDGLTIPAFLTLPLNITDKKVPLIVYPHGGPWSHDKWGFDNYVQFFAYQGYAVFQPQFRGSTGYGAEHKEKGHGQWGYAIQDDITDGVQWLVKQGKVDPKRICIVGASFGGYAAAMGLAKTPNLYQCGVSIAGVLDLEMHLMDQKNYLYGNIFSVTSNDKSTAEEVSPFHLTQNIQAPLLLIHGSKDTVVPVEHSIKMFDKMTDLKKTVKYLELEDGEHWRTNETNEIKTLEALEQFLAKYLK